MNMSLVLQQQRRFRSSSVPFDTLALADEVQKWPVSFEATIEADVLQNTQNSAGIG